MSGGPPGATPGADPSPGAADAGAALLSLYDRALPQVYGYLLPRVGSVGAAEDLTAETFLAAVTEVQRGGVPHLTVAWLVGVARHKLVDHWRREGREQRKLDAVGRLPDLDEDPWDERLDAARARATLDALGSHHRCALALRYLDDLPVPEVASYLGRSVHATEALLVRARSAFRRAYDEGSDDGR